MPTSAQTRAASYGPDQATYSAASLRGALRGEPYPITVLATSKTFVVPDAWKGALVRIQAEGADVFYVISTDATQAVADKTALAGETGGPPIVLTPATNGCGRIYNGQWQDIPFPAGATTFALQGAVACVARCHLAES